MEIVAKNTAWTRETMAVWILGCFPQHKKLTWTTASAKLVQVVDLGTWRGPQKVGTWRGPQNVGTWRGPQKVGTWRGPKKEGNWKGPQKDGAAPFLLLTVDWMCNEPW